MINDLIILSLGIIHSTVKILMELEIQVRK